LERILVDFGAKCPQCGEGFKGWSLVSVLTLPYQIEVEATMKKLAPVVSLRGSIIASSLLTAYLMRRDWQWDRHQLNQELMWFFLSTGPAVLRIFQLPRFSVWSRVCGMGMCAILGLLDLCITRLLIGGLMWAFFTEPYPIWVMLGAYPVLASLNWCPQKVIKFDPRKAVKIYVKC
jgi:hypothetical protein